MILDHKQITDIIVHNPNKSLVAKGAAYNKTMRRHMYGKDLESHLSTIEGYEKEALKKLRVKYTKSNMDLFSRLGRPVDKVYTARGGSVYLNLSDAQKQKALSVSMDVRDGYSVRKWVEQFWTPHMLDDPYGFIFMEIMSRPAAIQAKNDGRSFVYPTYKAITCVYDYMPKGQKLEYVVFALTLSEKREMGLNPTDQLYRLVDDATDCIVKRAGDDVTVLDGYTLVNYFGEVPAMINSDIIDPSCDIGFLSLYHQAIELAEHFLTKGSIKVTHDFMHGFPKYYEYADDCGDCKGTGFQGAVKCPSCKGTGRSAMTKVSDVKLLPYPKKAGGEEDIMVTPNVAGYVSPDKTFYEIATSDIQLLEDLMNVTIWGTQSRVRAQGMSISGYSSTKTATEVMDEIKPQADRLHVISAMAERRHKAILDYVIRLNLSIIGYKDSSVNYGRRYMIEGPDVLWEKYSKARTDGASQEVLNDLLIEYYEAKYINDPVKLAILLKLKDVEPYVHNTIDDLKEWPIPPFDKVRKAYFLDWRTTKSDIELLIETVEQLKNELTAFVIKKSQEAIGIKDDTALTVKLGIGGTQALQAFIADPNILPEPKRHGLIHVFGVKEEVAKLMVPDAAKVEPVKEQVEPVAA